ncbi:MAG: SH3 domain-containing protein [Myxococcaceae bacterium]
MILSLALMTVLTQVGYFTPEEAQAIFVQSNEAYYREDYAAAEQGYQKLLQRGFGGADVLFNLGTTALAANKLGEAVLYLERARLAGGREEDVEANLSLARSKQIDQVVGGQAGDTFLRRLSLATSERWVSGLFLVAWLLGFALMAARRRWHSSRLLLGAFLCFSLAIPAGALTAAHLYVRETLQDAVVLAATLPARELPKPSAKISFEVHAGLKVRVLEASGRYVKIRLPNGLEGWAEKEGVAAI